jgi:SAM-dependent methyltransferase
MDTTTIVSMTTESVLDIPPVQKRSLGIDPRALIVNCLRGRFVTPVLAQLGERGVLDRLTVAQLHLTDYPQFNQQVLRSLLEYLMALALVEMGANESWQATPLGRQVFQRWGSFAIVDSYESYFSRLDELLLSDIKPTNIQVDRKRNVVGSGQLHTRKFFPAALDMLEGDAPDILVDVGCGDGAFLEAALGRFPHLTVVAVDISAESLKLAYERLAPKLQVAWHCAVADGADVAHWSQAVPRSSPRIVVTGWFVLHEFCRGSVERARDFFFSVKEHFPATELLIGEVVKAAPDILAENSGRSVLPEFQLFHALSGQGLMTWNQFLELRADIPFVVSAEKLIDPLSTADGSVPANLIWHLKPVGPTGAPVIL